LQEHTFLGKSCRLRDAAGESGDGPMPLFLASKAPQPFIHAVFEGVDLTPVDYIDVFAFHTLKHSKISVVLGADFKLRHYPFQGCLLGYVPID